MSASFLTKLFQSGYPLYSPAIRGLLKANIALSNFVTLQTNTVSISAASTTYTNLTNATMSIAKQHDNATTDILVLVGLSARVDTASRILTVGVTDSSGTTIDLTRLWYTNAGEHLPMIGGGKFTARNISTVSLQFQMKNSGTGIMTMDGNDEFSALAWEVLK